MNFESFKKSIDDADAPNELSIYLLSMWHDAKGNWKKAHDIIQDEEDKIGSWVHAYLHRKEGDIWNADYWYRKAGRERPTVSLEEEWKNISMELIND
jgi:hypothetical protein